MAWGTAGSSSSSHYWSRFSPVQPSTSPASRPEASRWRRRRPGMTSVLEWFDPPVQWHRHGARCVQRAAAGGPSQSVVEAAAGLDRRKENPAAHFCRSQVDGRGVLHCGTERLVPGGSAPASALSC